ncbi:unnamed protein product, partial [marine sediment metagenome]
WIIDCHSLYNRIYNSRYYHIPEKNQILVCIKKISSFSFRIENY